MNASRKLRAEEMQGDWLPVQVVNPNSICCDASLMVCALRTVGVKPHPAFGFTSRIETVNGEPVTIWRWVLAMKSADGLYETSKLIEWWNDPVWHAANPTHEFALVCRVLRNMGVHAVDVNGYVPRVVVRQGRNSAHIPVNATPGKKAHLLGQMRGTIPLNERYVEAAQK